VNKMCNAGVSVSAYAGYVDALQSVSLRALTVIRDPGTHGRHIWVERDSGFITDRQVTIVWSFDRNDILTNIAVDKRILSL